MDVRRITTLYCYLMLLISCLCDLILPSFHWNQRNTIFEDNKPGKKKKFCRDPPHIYVDYGSEFYFICPNQILDVAVSKSRLKKYYLFENIHRVNEDGFNKCQVDRSDSLLLKCDRPLRTNALKFELVMFQKINWNWWSFKPNNTYYFINTSNGTMAGLDRKSGGRCETHNMKLKVTVCFPEQKCSQCKGMCCEKPPTTKPPTTTATTTKSTSSTRKTTSTRKVLFSTRTQVTASTLLRALTKKAKSNKKPNTEATNQKIKTIVTRYHRKTTTEYNNIRKLPEFKGVNHTGIVLASQRKADKDSNFLNLPSLFIGIGITLILTFIIIMVQRKIADRKRAHSDSSSDTRSGTDSSKNPGRNRSSGIFSRLLSTNSANSGQSDSTPSQV